MVPPLSMQELENVKARLDAAKPVITRLMVDFGEDPDSDSSLFFKKFADFVKSFKVRTVSVHAVRLAHRDVSW